MKTYTLIAIKNESSDYVMGCHMDSYPGDFIEEHNLTEEQLIEQIANLDSRELRINETGYHCSFFEEPPPLPEEEQNRIQEQINTRTKQLVEKREAAELAKKEAEKAAQCAAAEARERAEFERLKGKFGEKPL